MLASGKRELADASLERTLPLTSCLAWRGRLFVWGEETTPAPKANVGLRASLEEVAMWPEGIRSAAVLTFDFDAEEVWISSLGSEVENRPGILSQGTYGAKVGVPLLLALLASRGLKATFFVPGRVCERHPEAVSAIVDGGHEIGLHGYTHTDPSTQSAEEEREELEKSLEILRGFGVNPKGYRSPSWEFSSGTLSLLAEYGIEYSSNYMDDIRPYRHPSGLIELPVQWILDDSAHFWFAVPQWEKSIAPARQVLEIWKEEFMGIHRFGGCVVLTMHPQFIGRPGRIAMLERLLDFIERYDDVWLTTAHAAAVQARRAIDADLG
jgi:peptidoglycan/xylan/chitin deacetylase (PgdA/CDA1 family)